MWRFYAELFALSIHITHICGILLTQNLLFMPENVFSAAKRAAKNGIETTITFKSPTVCLISLSKNGAKAEQLASVSHRGVPEVINELSGKLSFTHDLEKELGL
jgi:hypothetical protein